MRSVFTPKRRARCARFQAFHTVAYMLQLQARKAGTHASMQVYELAPVCAAQERADRPLASALLKEAWREEVIFRLGGC